MGIIDKNVKELLLFDIIREFHTNLT